MAKFGIAVHIELLGADPIVRKLNRLPQAMQRKIVRKAQRKAFRRVLRSAKAKVPVDKGRLRRSLKLRTQKRSRRSIGVLVQTGTHSQLGIPSGKGYYPFVVHYGAPKRGIPPRPFLSGALEENEAQVFAHMAREVWAGIRKEVA